MDSVPLIQKCSSPVLISDHRGGKMYVNCGKCESCRMSYKSAWQSRLNDEALRSKATLFFTLTYSNEHIPMLEYDSVSNAFYSNRSHKDDIYVDDFNLNEFTYIPQIQNYNKKNCVGYVCKADVQKFLKRLRRAVEYDTLGLLSDVSPSERQIRYFITSEYGPRTYRPHYHGLLYFDNIHVARAVEKHYIYKCWKLCNSSNINISEVVSAASSYVSKYVSCDTDCPNILQVAKKTKTFFLCSRRPAIGVSLYTYAGLSLKIQYNTTKVVRYIEKDGVPTSVRVPIPGSVSRYFYPKLYKSSTYDNKELYEFYSSISEYVRSGDREYIKDMSYDDAYKYISSIIPNYVKDVNQLLESIGLSDDWTYHNKSTIKLSDIYSQLSILQVNYGIYQNRCCLIRSVIFMVQNDVSLYEYIDNYSRFYSIRASESMEFFYDCQNYYKSVGYSNIDIARYMYPSTFMELPYSIVDVDNDVLSFVKMLCSGLGIEMDDLYPNGRMSYKFTNINTDYINTMEYNMHKSDVADRNLLFNKSRDLNHYINQNHLNYEAF